MCLCVWYCSSSVRYSDEIPEPTGPLLQGNPLFMSMDYRAPLCCKKNSRFTLVQNLLKIVLLQRCRRQN
jgi:hypothetical protein